MYKVLCLLFFIYLGNFSSLLTATNDTPCIYYWTPANFTNFGDYLSLKLFERIINHKLKVCSNRKTPQKKILGIGSIISHAKDHDIIWGSGAKSLKKESHNFNTLDVRAVRGPLTRKLLINNNIKCPEIYGDPALLVPYFFPEFQKSKSPRHDYIIIPHFSENHLFPKNIYPNAVYTTEPWDQIIKKILDSKFVISSSLHGIIVAEAYNIPARMLKITEREPLFKYQDYYYGTNRFDFKYATSLKEALLMGGESPFKCDLKKLYKAFPFEFWPNKKFKILK